MLTLRNKRILIFLGSFALLFLVIFFVFNPVMEVNERIGQEVSDLNKQHQKLLSIQAKLDEYEEETKAMQKEISEYTAKFPAEVKTEDGFVLGMNVEAKTGATINGIAVGPLELLSSVSGMSQTSDETTDETLSEENNEETQTAINEIEGVEEETTGGTITTTEMSLLRSVNTMAYVGSYENLKSVLNYIASQDSRMTVDSVDLSFDSGTGGLSGSLAVNMFCMTHTEAVYKPPTVDGVQFGKENIFGTIKQPNE